MFKKRTFFLALLIPLLLDLLVFFSVCPSRGEYQTGLSECAPEIQKGFREVEERTEEEEEEEEDSFSSGLLPVVCCKVVRRVVYGSGPSFSVISSDSPLASGWMLPLRI